MLSQLGLTYIQNKLNDFLLVNTESDFVKSMKDYSNTGKYDVGNEIVDKDLGTLFKFGYDKTQGAIISDDSVNLNDVGINIDNLQATDSTEYDQGNMLFETKDFTNYNGYGGTYGMAEFMPGFKLHVKIINKDVTTKSQICHLDLLMGVSVIDQSTGKYSDIA
jgi:antitoxin component YwqK of YwqJK toxin-antitoxin module